MIKVYHLKPLTEEQRQRLNASGWDAEPEFRRYADITTFGQADEVREAWQLGEYELVAEVESDDLDVAFERTNHIDRNWMTNSGVTVKTNLAARSTSVGDVMCDQNGALYIVSPLGFSPLPLVQP